MTRDQVIAELLDDILRREGWPKVTEHPFDKGGLTKGGVTYRSYGHWRAKQGLKPLSREAFAQITEGHARAFFVDEFLTPFMFIADDKLFGSLADWSVNAGPDDPARALQQALRVAGADPGAIDGVVGPKTRAAWDVVKADPDTVARITKAVGRARLEFHLSKAFGADVQAFLIAHPKSQLWNARGWILRAYDAST